MDKSTSRHTHNKQSGRLTFTQRARQDQLKIGQTEWQTENVSHCVKVVHRVFAETDKGQTGALTDRWIDQLREKRRTYIQGDRTQTDEQTDGKTDGYKDRQTGRKMDRQTDTQTDRQTDRQTDTQTDRRANRSFPKCPRSVFVLWNMITIFVENMSVNGKKLK